MGADPATLETIRSTMRERGTEFFFAQFVDLYGRPSAKLIPRRASTAGQDGAGFAGFAAGEIGQLPSDPDIAAIPTWTASRSCRGSRTWPGSRVT